MDSGKLKQKELRRGGSATYGLPRVQAGWDRLSERNDFGSGAGATRQSLETQSKSYDQLPQPKLDERLEKLEGKSLLTKVDCLFARCSLLSNVGSYL
jgi:hypothetical protein